MPDWEDYYKILQVDPSAEPEVIDAAYKKLAQKYHPDKDKSAQATEHMKRINRAHDVLSDPAQRRDYHQEWLRRQGKQPPSSPPAAPPQPAGQRPAEIVLSSFFISPENVQLGGSVNISVMAINNGVITASKTIAMTGDFTGSQTITLKPGAKGIAKLTITPKTIGNFNVSIGPFAGSFSVTAPRGPSQTNIVLSNFSISSEQTQLYGRVRVAVTATNKGDTASSMRISMTGDFSQSRTVTLRPGASTVVRFIIIPKAIGTLNVSIGQFTGTLSVSEPKVSPRDLVFLLILVVALLAIVLPIVFFGIFHK